MSKIETEAWVLYSKKLCGDGEPLRKEKIIFDDITDDEILAEPIYGSWEANMLHAIERTPLDVCQRRREDRVVLGNAGVVRVLKTGANVSKLKEGDLAVFLPTGPMNNLGYVDKTFAFGYDEPGSIGMLSKRTKLLEIHLQPIPNPSKVPLHLWPMVSVRFGPGWSNWRAAEKCWQAQATREEYPAPHVWGWGGGVALSELLLARNEGFKPAMIASSDDRLEFMKKLGITPIDRRQFPDLHYDHKRYNEDRDYRKRYFASLNTFRKIVEDVTDGEGVSIFIENIGPPVYPATIRVLARPGVIATQGWKLGMDLEVNRAMECFARHIHVYTHSVRYNECPKIVEYAENNDWVVDDGSPVYDFDNIGQLVEDYKNGNISSYCPTFKVNPE